MLLPNIDSLFFSLNVQDYNLNDQFNVFNKVTKQITFKNDRRYWYDEINSINEKKEELALENDRLKYHNSEIKEIIVDMGLNGKVELLENYKNENEKKDFIIKKLENKLNDNQDYIENLKSNLFSGINQLFEQKPMQTNQIEEIKSENISKINQEGEESIEKKVLNLKNEGKSPRQIASMTNLTTIKIDEILKKHERREKRA